MNCWSNVWLKKWLLVSNLFLNFVIHSSPEKAQQQMVAELQSQLTAQMQKLLHEPHGFAAGTLVKTPYGYSAIENLRTGDLVVAIGPQGRQMHTKILGTATFKAKNAVALQLADTKLITCDNQFFRCQDLISWRAASDFKPKMHLANLCGKEIVCSSVTKLEEPVDLVALSLEQSHFFYVTKDDLIVHNFIIAALAGILNSGFALKIAGVLAMSFGAIYKAKESSQQLAKVAQQQRFHKLLDAATTSAAEIDFSKARLIGGGAATKNENFLPEYVTSASGTALGVGRAVGATATAATIPQLFGLFIVGFLVIEFVEWFNQEGFKHPFVEKLVESICKVSEKFGQLVTKSLKKVAHLARLAGKNVKDFVRSFSTNAEAVELATAVEPVVIEPFPGLKLEMPQICNKFEQYLSQHVAELPAKANSSAATETASNLNQQLTDALGKNSNESLSQARVENHSLAEVPHCQSQQVEIATKNSAVDEINDVLQEAVEQTNAHLKNREQKKAKKTAAPQSSQASSGGSGGNPEPNKDPRNNPKHRDNVVRAENMEEVMRETELGKKFKQGNLEYDRALSRKTGKKVYVLGKKVTLEDGTKLKAGDRFYLDDMHKDHVEWFRGEKPQGALNLNGSVNVEKTIAAQNRLFGGK